MSQVIPESPVTPERVKEILSSLIVKSHSADSSHDENKTRDSNLSVPEEPVAQKDVNLSCQSWSKVAFFKRVHSFSPLSWTCKPVSLSPIQCARYGWQNIDFDMLRCVTCKALLSAELPKSGDAQAYKEYCGKLQKSLLANHVKHCSWRANPSPDSFKTLSWINRQDAVDEFETRWKSLCELKDNVPFLTDSILQKLDITHDDCEKLSEDILGISDVEPDGLEEVRIILSVTGWQRKSPSTALLYCTLCNRQIGLWNYQQFKSPKDTVENNEPPPKKVKTEAKVAEHFNPLIEHHDWCPWVSFTAIANDDSFTTNTCDATDHTACNEGWKGYIEILLFKNANISDHIEQTPQSVRCVSNVREILGELPSFDSPENHIVRAALKANTSSPGELETSHTAGHSASISNEENAS